MLAENSRDNSPRHAASSTPDVRTIEGSRAEGTDGNSAVASLSTRSVSPSRARVASGTYDGVRDSTIPNSSGHCKQNRPSAASQQASVWQVANPFTDDFACLAGEIPRSSLCRGRPKPKGKKPEPKEGIKQSTYGADRSSPQCRKSIQTAATCDEGRRASMSATHMAENRAKGPAQQLYAAVDADQAAAEFYFDQATIEKKCIRKKQDSGQKHEHRTHRPSIGSISSGSDADAASAKLLEIPVAGTEYEEGPGAPSKDVPSRRLSTMPGESNLSERRLSKDGATKTQKKRPSIHCSNAISKDFFGGSEESANNSLYDTNKELDQLAQVSPEFSQLVYVKKMSLRKHSLREQSGVAARNLSLSSRSEFRSSPPDTSRTPSRQPATLVDTQTRNKGTKGLGMSLERSGRGSHYADVKGGIVNEQEKHLPFAESGSVKQSSSDVSHKQPGRSIHGPSEEKEDDKGRNEVLIGVRSSAFPHEVDSPVERKKQDTNVLAPASSKELLTPDEKQDAEGGVHSTFTFSPEFSDDRKTSEHSDASTLQVSSAPVRNGQLGSHPEIAAVSSNALSSPIQAGMNELLDPSTMFNETLRGSDVDSTPSAVNPRPHEKSLADADRATSQLETLSFEGSKQAPLGTADNEQKLASQKAGLTGMRESSQTDAILATPNLGSSVPTRINAQLEIVSETASAIQDRSEKLPEECLFFNPSAAPLVGMLSDGDRDKVTDSEVKVTTHKLDPSSSGFPGTPIIVLEFPDEVRPSSSDYAETPLIVLELPDQDRVGEINNTSSQGNAPRVCPASNTGPDDAYDALEAEVKLMMGMDAGKPPTKADISMEDFEALTEGDERAMRNLTVSSDISALQKESDVGRNSHVPAAEHSIEHTAAKSQPTLKHAREVALNSPTSTKAGSGCGQQLSHDGPEAVVRDLTVVTPQDAPHAQCTEASSAKSVLPKKNSSSKRSRHGSDATPRHSRSESMTRHKRKKAYSFLTRCPGRAQERSLSVPPSPVSGTATGSRNLVHKDDVNDSAALFGVTSRKSTSERDLWQELSGMLTQPVSVGVSVPAVGEVVVLVDEHASSHDQVNHVLPAGSYANIQELDISGEKTPVITNGNTM